MTADHTADNTAMPLLQDELILEADVENRSGSLLPSVGDDGVPTTGPLPGSYTYDYPRPSVTVDIVAFAFFENDLKVLLVQRRGEPFKDSWALPGGFVRMGEDLPDAAHRELVEETAVEDLYLEQLYTFGEPDRDPRHRVITVSFFSLIASEVAAGLRLEAGTDAGDARWWSVYEHPELAFDHARILEYALQRLRWKLEWTGLGFLLLPEEFTLSELQRVYERVLDETLDKRNFRRKFLDLDILEETGNLFKGDHRPAKLYRFTAETIELEQKRRKFP